MRKNLIIKQNNGRGWFSNFYRVIDGIKTREKLQLNPYVDFSGSIYSSNQGYNKELSGNSWNYYYENFKRQYQGQYTFGNQIPFHVFVDTTWSQNCLSYQHRKSINDIINKYICFNEIVQNKIDNFLKNFNCQNATAVHIRGTDWIYNPSVGQRNITIQDYIKYIDEKSNIFIMSDNYESVSIFKQKFGDRVYFYDSLRQQKYQGPAFHIGKYKNNPRIGQDVIIQAYIASRCKKLIRAQSNVSLAILLYNPTMELIHVK